MYWLLCSFSKAADELGLTTSAISYTIKRMEAGLDVVLFTRVHAPFPPSLNHT
jgi:DNA-binding transcriptional LysR family regulator